MNVVNFRSDEISIKEFPEPSLNERDEYLRKSILAESDLEFSKLGVLLSQIRNNFPECDLLELEAIETTLNMSKKRMQRALLGEGLYDRCTDASGRRNSRYA